MKHTKHHFARGSASGLSHILPFVVCFILLQSVSFSVHAQGNWLWANYWTGNDDPLSSTNAYNYVVKTAFDEDGNIYAFGACGGSAQIADQNQNVYMLNIPSVLTANTMGSVLAKYDRNGNLLWHRLIKNSGSGEDCYPFDMFFDGDRIMISGNYMFQANDNLWFFDTLIYHQHVSGIPWEEQRPPFAVGNFTYFVTFDLDGNRLATSIIHTLSREFHESIGMRGNSFLGNRGTMCVDSRGSTYIAVDVTYTGPDTMPYTIVVDKDTNRMSVNVYFPENCCYINGAWSPINNTLLYKFSSDWELEWMRRVVDHAEGLSPYLPRDTINPCYVAVFGGLSIDDNDELYLSGYLSDMWCMDEYNQYPMRIYWDSVHYAKVLDYATAYYLPYIIKYNSDGEVQWSNQIYISHAPATPWYNKSLWKDNHVDNNSVYITGQQYVADNVTTSLFYFDDESNSLPNKYEEYFVRFNAQTGAFENFGVVPGDITSTRLDGNVRPDIINNHLITLAGDPWGNYTLLCYFNTDGEFIKADTITYSYDNFTRLGSTIVSNDGYILCDMMNSQNLTFGHDLTLDLLGDTHSHAIIALKYDPSILEPYPEEPVEVKKYDERLDRIRLYPNPATDRITIESAEDLPIDGVAITNLEGQFLGVQLFYSTTVYLNISYLPAGTYIAHINTRMGNTDRKFVVGR